MAHRHFQLVQFCLIKHKGKAIQTAYIATSREQLCELSIEIFGTFHSEIQGTLEALP